MNKKLLCAVLAIAVCGAYDETSPTDAALPSDASVQVDATINIRPDGGSTDTVVSTADVLVVLDLCQTRTL